VNVVDPLTSEGIAVPEPGILLLGTPGLVAPVLGPLDVRGLAEDAGLDEGPDVHPDAVVEVRVPADRLLGKGLPADEDVVRRLAGQDELELLLERLGGGQTQVGPGFAVPGIGGRTASVPVTGRLSWRATRRAFLSSRMSLAADRSIDKAVASASPAPRSRHRD